MPGALDRKASAVTVPVREDLSEAAINRASRRIQRLAGASRLRGPARGPGWAQRRRRVLLLLVVDMAMIAITLGVNLFSATRSAASTQPPGFMALTVALTLGLIAVRGGYRFRLRVSRFDDVGRIVASTAVATMLVVATRVLLAPDPAIAVQSVRLWGFTTAYLAAGRVALAIGTSRAPGLSTLVVGAGDVGRTVARRLRERPGLGLRPVGFLDKDPRVDLSEEDPPVLGASWDLEEVALRLDIEHVIVAFSRAPHSVLLSVVRRCRAMGIEVSLVPRLFEEVSGRVTIEHLGGVALLRVDRSDPRGWQFEVKYAIDRVAGALALLVLSPVLAVLALSVKLSSPGPVLFRQSRIGLNGEAFDIFKFRTMRVTAGAPQQNAGWAAKALSVAETSNEDRAVPDRRTRVGAFLRHYSIDELPQLLNVVKGDMSLVGPRPEQTRYVDAFEDHIYRYGDRHRVKSGLTGWAQVQGLRGETSLQERVEWDNFYVENWSPLLDLKIMLLTLPAVLSGSREEG